MKLKRVFYDPLDDPELNCVINGIECYYFTTPSLRKCPIRKDGSLQCVHKYRPGHPLKAFIFVREDEKV